MESSSPKVKMTDDNHPGGEEMPISLEEEIAQNKKATEEKIADAIKV
jgi:hypothetical protein